MSLDILETAKRAKQANEHRKYNALEYFAPYDYQKRFYFAEGHETPGKLAAQRALISANQIGKTTCEAYECAFMATGKYPEWWKGHRYDGPVSILVASNTNEQTKDNCQKELFGEPSDDSMFGTGAVPKADIGEPTRKPGVPNAFDSVMIKHISGGWSKISFRAYEQGKKKFMGSRHHHVWADEEPPQDIWSQMLRSTFSTDGDIAATFTPEEGVTEVVYSFLSDIKKGQAVIQAGWDDAPHMTKDRREQFLAQIPEFERDMRTKGIPVMGSGLIFPINDEQITCEPFPIPRHFARICGIDFGWEHPFAAVWMAHDRDTNTVYVYDIYRESRALIPVSSARIKGGGSWIPCVWPHDGLHHDKQSGKTLADLYREQGVNMLPHEFTNPPAPGQKEGQGGQGVEAGLMAMFDCMSQGRFKVFSTLSDWFKEKGIYHRKDGKVVKLRDDLMSATRYAFQSLRHAQHSIPTASKTKVRQGLSNWG